LNNEIEKDNKDLEVDKKKLINQIKTVKKEELFKKEKLTIWQRIKKVLF
jgi:hypothetical protein